MHANFSTRSAISQACKLTKHNWYIIAIIWIAVYIITKIISGIGRPSILCLIDGSITPAEYLAANFAVWSAIGTILSWVAAAGMTRMFLNLIDGTQPDFNAFKMPAGTYINYVLCEIVQSICIIIGLLLLIIPGIFVLVRLFFAPYYVIDKGMAPIEAIKASWNDTQGNWWHLCGALILLALFSFAGYLLLIIGAIYTVPVAMVAQAIVYRAIANNQSK